MKFLIDLAPVILFFATYRLAEARADSAFSLAQNLLGSDFPQTQAPILLATLVALGFSVLQVGYLLARRRKVDVMLWLSFAIIVVFGGATLLFHNPTFIKWKPTVLYWSFAAALMGGQLFMRRNLIRSMMQQAEMQLPEAVWTQLLLAWIAFFVVMGGLNLYVAYNFSESAWVNFKVYGGTGLMLVFVLLQALMIARFMEDK
ncbi:MAG: septation protein A [Rhodocyclaceae bacterium]|nr:septation protein A [Rhodocyclaceae bacterium]MBX3670532.1 septation protein A [Rhodocyclaceae bacterium]